MFNKIYYNNIIYTVSTYIYLFIHVMYECMNVWMYDVCMCPDKNITHITCLDDPVSMFCQSIKTLCHILVLKEGKCAFVWFMNVSMQ